MRFVVALACAFGSVSCSTIAQNFLEKPKAEIRHVKLRSTDGASALLVVGIEVENPNSISLKVDRLKYDVEIAGRPLTAGALENPADIPARGKQVVEIPLKLKYSDVFSSMVEFMQTLQQKKPTQYRIRGAAKVGIFELPFDEKGELKIGE